MLAWLAAWVAILLSCMTLFPQGSITIKTPVPLNIVYSNSPACSQIESSTDLTNWFCVAELRRCDGRTNAWPFISWFVTDKGTNLFFRVLPCQ